MLLGVIHSGLTSSDIALCRVVHFRTGRVIPSLFISHLALPLHNLVIAF